MSLNTTQPTDRSVAAYLAGVTPPRRGGAAGGTLFREGDAGRGLVGYGRYDYRHGSGWEGSFLATGFPPRARARSDLTVNPRLA